MVTLSAILFILDVRLTFFENRILQNLADHFGITLRFIFVTLYERRNW